MRLWHTSNVATTNELNPVLKPLLRGHFHQAAFFFALGACVMLLANTESVRMFIAAFIYSFCLVAQFGISALYHRPQWNESRRKFMRKLDHSAIFALIAGTATPVCLFAVQGPEGVKLLAAFWVTAAVGILQSLFWTGAPKWVSIPLYIFCGWLALPYLNEIGTALGPSGLALIFSGGVVYTLGALVYGLKWPNPAPRIFGYHEVFHLLVIVAAILHFIAIVKLVN